MKRVGQIFLILILTAHSLAQAPIGHWTFEEGEELIDLAGNFEPLRLKDAKIEDGYLRLDSASLAYSLSYSGPNIYGNKTIVCWLILDDLDAVSGMPFVLEAEGRGFFDALLYNNLSGHTWGTGSNMWLRSRLEISGKAETETGKLIRIALVHEEIALDKVAVRLYREDELNTQFEGAKNEPYYTGGTQAKFGFFGSSLPDASFWMRCRIEEVQLYNRALSFDEIKSLKPKKIAPSSAWIYFAGATVLFGLIAFFLVLRWRKKVP